MSCRLLEHPPTRPVTATRRNVRIRGGLGSSLAAPLRWGSPLSDASGVQASGRAHRGKGHWPLTASAQNGRESTLVTLRWPEVTAAGDRSLPPAPGQGKEVESGGLGHKPEAGEAGCDPRA